MPSTVAFATARVANMKGGLGSTGRRRRPAAVRACIVILAFLLAGCLARSQAQEPQLPPIQFLLTWGKEGTEPGEFHFPIGIAINAADEILITDHYNGRVQKFDSQGNLLARFAVLPNPGGIALDRTGKIYLSHFPAAATNQETYPDRISVYSPTGERLQEWGKSGSGPLEFNYPGGMVIAPDDRLFIADQTNHRIQVLDLAGRFLKAWGRHGTIPGEFGGNYSVLSRVGGPNFVACDSQGHLYTTEAMDGRVQKFTADGAFVSAFGNLEDRPGGFGREFQAIPSLHGPVGICCDRHDRLWIAAAGGRVQQFTGDGRYLRGLGEIQGSEPGQFLAPHGVALDSLGHLYVVDAYNHRVQKFDVGGN